MLIIQLVIIQIVTFAALVFVMRKAMYSASVEETRRLQLLNEENAKKAQELSLKIEEAQKQCRDRIAAAEEEATKLKVQAKEDARKFKEDALNKAKHEGERIMAQALSAKEEMRHEVETQMEAASIARSLKLVRAVLSSESLELLHQSCLREVIQEIEKIEDAHLRVTVSEGSLITPYEIDPKTKDEIAGLLSGKTGKTIVLDEKIDREIIAGITIKLGSMMIDGSLSGKLKAAQDALSKG